MKLIFAFIFMAVVLSFQCFQLKAVSNAKSTLATIDLRSKNFDAGTVLLQGEVNFQWGTLLMPTEANTIEDKYTFPKLWGDTTAKGVKTENFGFATYAFNILLPQGYHLQNRNLAFAIEHTYCAYEIYVQGDLLGNNGKVASSKEFYEPYWKPQVLTFSPRSDTVQVMLKISNFDHSKGGIRADVKFGRADIVNYDFDRDMAFDYILTGCLLMGGLFFLGFYFFGRNDYSLLFFALFCIIYSYRIIGAKNYGLHYLVPNLQWHTAIVFEYATLYLSGIAFLLYTYLLYPVQYKKSMIYVTGGITFLFLITTLVTPPRVFTALLNPYFVVFLIMVCYLLYVYLRAYRAKLEGASFAIVSFGALGFSFTYDILAYFLLVDKNSDIIFFSYLSFFFLQSLILSKRFAATYRNAIQRSMEARIAKIDFLSIVSHEIRTPLNAIIGMSNLLRVPADQDENLNALKISANNLLMLINDILDYTKLSSGKLEFDRKPTNVVFLTENLIRGFRNKESIKNNVKLILIADPEIPKYLHCDGSRLSQILNNLIGNALKFTEEGTVKVIVRLESRIEDNVRIQFIIEDTGVGIPSDKYDEIFETFTQLNNSSTRKYGGTGLGLAITKNLLQLQGSNINLSSEVGVGSKFSFALNMKVASHDQHSFADKEDIENVEKFDGTRVLVVEDNEMNILVARKFLQKWNCTIDIAKNGQEALDLYYDHDLILMDLQMPVMDGYTATKKFREIGVTTPIIAITASALFDVQEKIFNCGMNDFIIKPFEPLDLHRKLKISLDLAKKTTQLD